MEYEQPRQPGASGPSAHPRLPRQPGEPGEPEGSGGPGAPERGDQRLAALADVLTEPGQALDARQAAAVTLAEAGDERAFETLVLLLNHRDPGRCEAAARALARLCDPRTGRAAAALATNPLRVAYALEPVRLLVRLTAPEAVPALSATLRRLVADPDAQARYGRVALACVEGLGALADPAGTPALRGALAVPRLRAAAQTALARVADAAARPRR